MTKASYYILNLIRSFLIILHNNYFTLITAECKLINRIYLVGPELMCK